MRFPASIILLSSLTLSTAFPITTRQFFGGSSPFGGLPSFGGSSSSGDDSSPSDGLTSGANSSSSDGRGSSGSSSLGGLGSSGSGLSGLGSLGGSSTSNELTSGSCRDTIFIFARGSTETGNMGSVVGPQTCSALKEQLGSDAVACQGIGGAYTADLASNALPDGTSSAAIDEGTKMFNLAQSQCPNSKVVAGGYSQGSALVAAAVGKLPSEAQAQVVGVVLYGYTKNQQNDGKIPGYPTEETKVFCNATDGVCGGALIVTAGHLTYGTDVNAAAQFLEGRVTASTG